MKARVSGLLGREPGSRQGSLVQTRAHKHAEQGSWVQTKLLRQGRGSLEQNRGARGAEQGSQEEAGVLAVDQDSHKCSRESCECRAGFWGRTKGLR